MGVGWLAALSGELYLCVILVSVSTENTMKEIRIDFRATPVTVTVYK